MPLNKPSADSLLESCKEFYQCAFLGSESVEMDAAQKRFYTLISNNILSIVQREIKLSEEFYALERKNIQILSGSSHCESLIEAINKGDFDLKDTAVKFISLMKEIQMCKLSIDNPSYTTYRRLTDEC
jgi:hypothetical protein